MDVPNASRETRAAIRRYHVLGFVYFIVKFADELQVEHEMGGK